MQSLDEKLMNERDTKLYRNKERKQTCLRTIMGDVEYSRRVYEFNLKEGKKDQKELLRFFKEGRVDEGLDVIAKIMILNNDNKKAFNKLVGLYDYLVSNRDGLIPYKF